MRRGIVGLFVVLAFLSTTHLVAKITEEESNRLTDIFLNSENRADRVGAASGLLAYYEVPESEHGLLVARQWQQRDDEITSSWGSLMLAMLDLVGIRDDQTKPGLLKIAQTGRGMRSEQAVNALSILGDDDLIEPMLQIFKTHPDVNTRERVACVVCHTGLFSVRSQYRSLPHFLEVLKSPNQDRQVKAWASQAMSEVTHQSFGLDAGLWEGWIKKNPAP